MPTLDITWLHSIASQEADGTRTARRSGKSIFALSKALGEIDLSSPLEYHIASLKEATATTYCKQMLWLAQEMGMQVRRVHPRILRVESTTVFFEFMTERGPSYYDDSSYSASPVKEKKDTKKVDEKIHSYHSL